MPWGSGPSKGFDQGYNAQAAVDHKSYLIVGESLSNHPNDQAEAKPTLESIPPQLGEPEAAALDNGFFSSANIEMFQSRGIEPYIATGRESHHQSWQERFADRPAPPPSRVDAAPP